MASKKTIQTAAAEASGDPQAEAEQQPQAVPAPIRRYFAGGGHIPELGLFVGSGQVLAEQQPDGTWRMVSEEDEAIVPAAVEAPAAAEGSSTPQDSASAEPGPSPEPAAESDAIADPVPAEDTSAA